MLPASSFQDRLSPWLSQICAENYHVQHSHVVHCHSGSPCYSWSPSLPVHVVTVTFCSSAHDSSKTCILQSQHSLRQVRQEPIQHHPKASGSLRTQRFQRQKAAPLARTTHPSTTKHNCQPVWGHVIRTSPPHVSDVSFREYCDQPFFSFTVSLTQLN